LIRDGIVYFQTEENGTPALEVKATYVKDHDFRVEADGVINDVNLVVYSKVFFLPLHR
jgi:hypothetical protein